MKSLKSLFRTSVKPVSTVADVSLQRQRGLTAIELIIGLAVIGLVIAGVAITAQTMFRDQRVNSEVQRALLMQQKARAYLATSTTTANFSDNVAINASIVPADAVNGTAINSKFGGTITFNPATLATTTDGLAVTYKSVPAKDCINFAKAVGDSFAGIAITTSPTTPATIPTTPATLAAPPAGSVKTIGGTYNEATAITACGTTNADIALYFSKV
ncbi:type 4 pilus major pilin [Noviherbaspirillum galbum]|uniref:Prepilin-type N-terminal cleavage/methylation domain-containing protein n=1 Tax=Noviherbaspirillum galbum TaxID=2709383 RepID=A0A6B3SUF6_9BURK|nr:type 4 pilus major pilin [Noviherbaspirillum galbum]NEX64221.1 prepilin-type N-terminal cleavage/methylation domain-containing protein [Noviherbaspirillum galbum]